MDRNKALQIYLIGTLGQIGLVCLAVFLSRRVVAVDYTTPAGMMAIALGGLSSALWGTVLSVKYKRKELSAVLMDFFGVLQRPGYYLLVFLFLFLDFFSAILGGGIAIEVWYTPIILFLKALVFGGIEEIGWRYFFNLCCRNDGIMWPRHYVHSSHGGYGISLISMWKERFPLWIQFRFCLDC